MFFLPLIQGAFDSPITQKPSHEIYWTMVLEPTTRRPTPCSISSPNARIDWAVDTKVSSIPSSNGSGVARLVS